MTATRTTGVFVIEAGTLVSTSPATGEEVGRFPVAGPDDVAAAVARAREAGAWWAELGFDGRRTRLLRYRARLARRLPELAALMRRETGKAEADALVETVAAIDHAAWAARHARRVLGPRKVRSTLLLAEFAAYLEYLPYGVVGVVGPWNYPVLTPMGSIAYALAAGNAVVFKPSEYTPAVGEWLVEAFAEVVPEQPVLQAVHGSGDTGAALCRSGVDKLAFTGSTATGRKVMAACAETLTPVLMECGGKDAMIVESDADLDAAASAAAWGGFSNAGQTCVGIERIYVAEPVYDEFVTKLVARTSALTVGPGDDAEIGAITMPTQVDVIRRHIEDAISRGGRVATGGPEAAQPPHVQPPHVQPPHVQPPYVQPTILLDVPEDALAVREETFGPTLTVTRVRDGDEAVRLANASQYGLGGSVFSRRRGLALARRLRTGMTAVNSALTFAGMPTLPFGGVGSSGFGRIHGDDGLREFARAKSITRRRAPSVLPVMSYARTPKMMSRLVAVVRTLHGRTR